MREHPSVRLDHFHVDLLYFAGHRVALQVTARIVELVELAVQVAVQIAGQFVLVGQALRRSLQVRLLVLRPTGR